MPDPALVARIRNRIVGETHLGHLRSGDRLPPVREMAREMDADHRAVAAAYRALADEGLVEVRGRQGAFVARQERLGDELPTETAGWLAGVLSEARRRRIGIPEFPGFVQGATGRVRLRCVCVESNRDSATAFRIELEEEFGLEVVEVSVRPGGGASLEAAEEDALRAALASADLAVTTAFHAHAVQAVAEAVGRPFVLLTVSADIAGIIERRLRAGPMALVAVDPAYAARFREIYRAPVEAGRLRVVLAGERAALASVDRSEPALVTRAARLMLPDLDLPLLLPRYPSLSPESARHLAEVIIRLNLETGR